MVEASKIKEFWDWFSSIAAVLSTNPEDEVLLGELDSRLALLDPLISWEIGPGKQNESQLVITPDLHQELLPLTDSIVSEAPRIEGWDLFSSRPPKDSYAEFEMFDGENALSVDARDWQYVLLRYPEGETEILLYSPNAQHLTNRQRDHAASILLQGILGESVLLNKDLSFHLTENVDDRFREKLKPLSDLRQAVCGNRET